MIPFLYARVHRDSCMLRRADPRDPTRLLMDRRFEPKVHISLRSSTDAPIDPRATNLFMGICQQHRETLGTHMPGCPPHAEAIMNTMFRLFPDMERTKYADETSFAGPWHPSSHEAVI